MVIRGREASSEPLLKVQERAGGSLGRGNGNG